MGSRAGRKGVCVCVCGVGRGEERKPTHQLVVLEVSGLLAEAQLEEHQASVGHEQACIGMQAKLVSAMQNIGKNEKSIASLICLALRIHSYLCHYYKS